MKMFLVTDNNDTLTGMRLAGVEGVKIVNRDELKEALQKAMADKSIGVVLIMERFGKEYPEIINPLKMLQGIPLVLEIPDRFGTGRKPDFITSYVNEAIGVKF